MATTREQAAEAIDATIDGEYVYYHDDGTNRDYRSDVATEHWLYRRSHDRGDNSVTITCEAIADDVRFEPWNGILPETCGDTYVVIVE